MGVVQHQSVLDRHEGTRKLGMHVYREDWCGGAGLPHWAPKPCDRNFRPNNVAQVEGQ